MVRVRLGTWIRHFLVKSPDKKEIQVCVFVCYGHHPQGRKIVPAIVPAEERGVRH